MVKKGAKLLPFDGSNINVFNLNVSNVESRKEDRDDDLALIYAVLDNMSSKVLEVVTLWAGEEDMKWREFVKRVRDYYCPEQPRSHLRLRLKATKPTQYERAKTFMSRLCSVVRSEGYDVEKEWEEVDQRLYEALLFPVSSSLTPDYFAKRKARAYKDAVKCLVEHLEERQHGTGARIWYTAGVDASADRTYAKGTGGEEKAGGMVKEERDHYALRRLAAVDDVEPVGAMGNYRDERGDVPTCKYCGKRGHTEDLCLKRISELVTKLTAAVQKIAPIAGVNLDFHETGGAQN